MFENKTICVFGGTGTIGSLIVEYLITQKPYSIRIFSNDEHSLWKAQQKRDGTYLRYLLGDIRDLERVKRALHKVDYVFNAAAIKHVPIAEYNPMEALKTNVNGLENIIEACVVQKVKKLLHISTDKACEPTTVMGSTKQIGEKLIQIRWPSNPDLQMVCVRLGNVLGSRGSLLPIIKKQKAEGKRITVTNPDMHRFFMKPEEVIGFIVKAFENGKEGEIWVPKLKEKSLMDVIKKEVGDEYPITIIGNRKGEKLHEKLLSDYEVSIADHTNREYWIIRSEYRRSQK